jgi:hypothetical protein
MRHHCRGASNFSTFKRIGDNWHENTWRKESYFNRSKKWASELAPSAARLCSFRQEAEANMATAEGVQDKKDFILKPDILSEKTVQNLGGRQWLVTLSL